MPRKNPKIDAANEEIKKLEDAGEFDDVRETAVEPDDVSSGGEIELDLSTVAPVEVVPDDEPAAAPDVSVLDAFVAWANSDAEADLAPFIEAGLLDKKHSLTSAGVKLLDAEKVGWRTVYFLKLGTQLKLSDGTVLLSGSSVMVLNGGQTKDGGSKYWMCFAGEQLPTFVVYQHRQHQFWDAKYPLAQKMGAKYTKVG
jgi:hypothetical protein